MFHSYYTTRNVVVLIIIKLSTSYTLYPNHKLYTENLVYKTKRNTTLHSYYYNRIYYLEWTICLIIGVVLNLLYVFRPFISVFILNIKKKNNVH